MLSGHVHRAMKTEIGKVTCQITPTPCHAVNLDHRLNSTNDLNLGPGAVTIRTWFETPTPMLVSDVLPVGRFPGLWPFWS